MLCLDIAPGKMFVQFFGVVKTRGESIAKATRECSEDKVSFEESSLGAGWVSQPSFTYAEAASVPNYHCNCLPRFSPLTGTTLKKPTLKLKKKKIKKILVSKFILWLGLDTSNF